MMQQSMWYYLQNGQQAGPIEKGQLLDLFSQQALPVETMVWAEGMAQWERACDVPGFFPPTMAVASAAAVMHARPGRPTSVTVLAILCLVFGGFGLLCTPISAIAVFMPEAQTPGMEAYDSAPMQMYQMVSAGIGFLCSFVLIAVGIGLLNLKNWARVTAYIYGWFAIVRVILGVLITILILTTSVSGMTQGGAGPEEIGFMVGIIFGGSCGSLIGLIFPICLIVYMRKPHVIAACR